MRRTYVALLALMYVMIASCGISQEKKDLAFSHYKLGQAELQTGNPQQALIKFHESLAIDSKNKETENALGTTYMLLAENEKAVEHYKRAIDLDGNYSEAWNNLCFIYYKNFREYDKAEKACQKALKNQLYATPEKPLYNLGRIYYRKKDYRNALTYTTKAIKRFPSLIGGYYSQALIYNAMGQYPEAGEAMRTAIGLDPRFQGNRKKAEKHFKKNKDRYEDGEAAQFIDILHY